MKIHFALPKDFASTRKLDRKLTSSQIRKKIFAREFVIAIEEGRVIGCLRFEWMWLKIPYLTWISVVPQSQRSGVAAALLRFLAASLKKKRRGFLLNSYQENAPIAKSWHQSVGFRRCGQIRELNRDGSQEIFCRLSL